MFGPTGLIPVLWLSPLEEPVALLLAAVGVGTPSLGAYVLGTVNRFAKVAGATLFCRYITGEACSSGTLGLLAAGIYLGDGALTAAAVVLGVVGLVLAFVGLLTTSGRGAAGVLRRWSSSSTSCAAGSNLVSFARLAAFGLTHAALGAIVWAGTTALWGPGFSRWRRCSCSSSATRSPAWKDWWPASRRCAWGTTSCSHASSTSKAGPSVPEAPHQRESRGDGMTPWLDRPAVRRTLFVVNGVVMVIGLALVIAIVAAFPAEALGSRTPPRPRRPTALP